ncbi:MAG: MBL fold metallo-hydrolase [Verrucomicrobia bacterium]|nr:MBL fold metallo-hydrolase [Verrucomicrobiota bacterium]
MNETILLTVLVENTVRCRGLKAEHGLAFHLQVGRQSLLFDTGQSDLVTENARLLSVDLTALDAVAISHGHYDHIGGLSAVRGLAPGAVLRAHPTALIRRFSRNPNGTTRSVGIPDTIQEITPPDAGPFCANSSPAEVLPGVFLTGEVPRRVNFEDVGGPFVLDEAGTQPDPIEDDQALFFDSREGVVVLLGCAHAGVVNTLRHIRELTGGRPIHAVLGGMHLLTASPERMERTVDALRELRVHKLGPAHCTGAAATARLWSEFPVELVDCSVGTRFVFHQ